jgi:SAM-dependent methyltransferase
VHQGNIDWLKDLNTRFASELREARLLELGSLNVNGTARDYLHVKKWVGIDKEGGPDVDIICSAIQTRFPPESFDVILCTSMLEHDPDWRASLFWNLQWLKKGGLFFLSWGAEGNQHHLPEPWAPVPAADVWDWMLDQLHQENLTACLDAYWEKSRHTDDCPGCFDMVLRK